MKTKLLLATMLLTGGIFTGNAQTNNLFLGQSSGINTDGDYNTFVGHHCALSNSFGSYNTIIGSVAAYDNVLGSKNVYIGYNAAEGNEGSENVMIGTEGTFGSNNTYIGYHAGVGYGFNNICIGNNAGSANSGSNNIFIGYTGSFTSPYDNKLYIENSASTTPLIWGDFAADQLKFNGKVGIGMGSTVFPTNAAGVSLTDYDLFVDGGILAKEIRVATTWADYVFDEDYKLLPLNEVESYIAENGHLPNVPSAKQVEEEGISLGEMAKIQQEKIEELTLYVIEQNKKLEKQEKEIQELKQMVQALAEKK